MIRTPDPQVRSLVQAEEWFMGSEIQLHREPLRLVVKLWAPRGDVQVAASFSLGSPDVLRSSTHPYALLADDFGIPPLAYAVTRLLQELEPTRHARRQVRAGRIGDSSSGSAHESRDQTGRRHAPAW